MSQSKTSTVYKIFVIALGSLCFVYACLNLEADVFSWGYVLLLVLASLLAPRISLILPYSNFAISFSDAIIFLTFLIFGGEAAIIMASVEVAAACFYLKTKGGIFGNLMIPANAASSALSTTISYFVLILFLRQTGIELQSGNLLNLIGVLGVLALSQFLISSSLAAVFHALKEDVNPWIIWKRECLSSSMTQIVGAVLAGVVYKLINNAALTNILIAAAIYAVFYLSYRQMINDINNSIEKAEIAERERGEAEKKRAEEAEQNLARMNSLFEEQEKISRALQKSKEQLERSTYYDPLTGVFNRKYLIERLELLLDLGIDIAHSYYVLFLDLSRFKNINDSLGHPIGDKVLTMVAKRLSRILRDEDTIARIGGDEFAIILNNMPSIEEAEKFAARIHRKISQPFKIDGHKIYTNSHIGISPFDSEHSKPEDVLRDADIAMHCAKEKKGAIAVFDKKLREHFLERINLEADLRFAIKRRELLLYYQPVVSLKTGAIVGFETLLRWQHPKHGFISPVQFIPIAEDSGLIIPMTEWILRESCLQMAKWREISSDCKNLKIGVNISGKHLAVEDLPEQVQKSLSLSGLPASSLTLELTESSAMENADQTIKIFKRLRKIGVYISIDDFGTGYSSLSYLHRLPFDSLKIDRSFVSGSTENVQILQTILALAKSLKLRTVAEGIETGEQLKFLQDLGCDLGQGFLFSRPLPKTEAESLLYQKNQWFAPPDEISDDAELTHDISGVDSHAF